MILPKDCDPRFITIRRGGTLTFGPSALGGLVRFVPDPSVLPAGRSIADHAIAAFAVSDAEFGTEIGALTGPIEVRGSPPNR